MKPSFEYLSQSPKYTSPSAISTYFYKELDIKNQNIYELKRRITELINDKAIMQKQLETLQNQNYASHAQCEQNTILASKENEQKQKQLLNRINLLETQNAQLKRLLHKEHTPLNSVYDTVEFKMNKQQQEINILTSLNNMKDNLLNQMQSFYNKLNHIVNADLFRANHFTKDLNYKEDDIDLYYKRVNEIEGKVLLQMNYDAFHNDTHFFQLKIGNDNQNFPTETNIKEEIYDEEIEEELPRYLKGTNYEKLINYMKKNNIDVNQTCITHPQNCILNQKARAKEQKYNEDNINDNGVNTNVKVTDKINNNKLLIRTPPRDEDYISPCTTTMDYLKTVNSSKTKGYSRKHYIFYP